VEPWNQGILILSIPWWNTLHAQAERAGMPMCVCVSDRERERERIKEGEREREIAEERRRINK